MEKYKKIIKKAKSELVGKYGVFTAHFKSMHDETQETKPQLLGKLTDIVGAWGLMEFEDSGAKLLSDNKRVKFFNTPQEAREFFQQLNK